MVEIPVRHRGGIVYAKVDERDAPLVQQFTWRLNYSGHAMTRYQGQDIRMPRFILGLMKGDRVWVTTLNSDPLDCRRANLAICDQGAIGKLRYRNKKDFYVYRVRRRWRATAVNGGKNTHIGYFASEAEAKAAALKFREDRMPFKNRRDA